MKKTLSFVLIVSLLFGTLCGCKKEFTDYVISEYDHESVIEISNANSANESETDKNNTYIVKEKKFVYNGTELIILDVKNDTSQNHSVTITGVYLDENGKELKTETKNFDQFYAGYQNYFLFNPGIAFSKFTYTLETNDTDQTMYTKDVNFKLQKVEKALAPIMSQIQQGDFEKYPSVIAEYTFSNSSSTKLQSTLTIILYNESDEIIAMVDQNFALSAGLGFGREYKNLNIYQTTEPEPDWPEWVDENIKAIFCINNVTT